MPTSDILRQKGKRKTQDPCGVCLLHKERCLCAQIPQLTLKTKLCLIIHAKELKRTTNTGTLAVHALTHSEMHVRGRRGAPLNLSHVLSPDFRSVLFFPSDDARELSEEFVAESSLPIQLIVPDGNWRQANKVHHRQKELSGLPRVKISAPNLESQHLRAESSKEGMATLKAIAEAYGIIEGEPVKKALLKLYRLKLERTLEGKGTVVR